MKKCGKCQQQKPLSDFGKDRHSKDGLSKHCKECKRQFNLDYRQKNHDKWLSDKKASREKNINTERRYRKKYYAENKQRIIDNQRKYAKNNPGKRSKIKAAYRSRRSKDCFVVLDREINRIKNSPCFACDATDRIEVDHVIPLARGGRHSVGNLMPLCRSCNASKGSKFLVEWLLADTLQF